VVKVHTPEKKKITTPIQFLNPPLNTHSLPQSCRYLHELLTAPNKLWCHLSLFIMDCHLSLGSTTNLSNGYYIIPEKKPESEVRTSSLYYSSSGKGKNNSREKRRKRQSSGKGPHSREEENNHPHTIPQSPLKYPFTPSIVQVSSRIAYCA